MLGEIIGIEIPLFPQITDEEIKLRIEQEEAAYLGKIAFIKGKISLEEYLDILEMCEVDIDDFLLTLENNLVIVGAV